MGENRMIPITTSTTLSIEKTAELLKSLVELKDKNATLSEKVSKSIDNLLDSQQELVKEIDNLMHTEKHYNQDEVELLTTIVEVCPEFLATKNENGCLPCHYAAEHSTSSFNKILESFAVIGRKHNIGGDDSRGGLLVPRDTGRIALQCIVNKETLEILREVDSPLFYVQDIQKYHLLHYAAWRCNLELAKYFIDLDPSCVNKMDSKQRLPIHYPVYGFDGDDQQEMVQYLLQRSVAHSTSNETIGGLFALEPGKNDFLINYMVEKAGMDKTWDCIERALSNQNKLDNLPCILHQSIQHTPQYCSEIFKRFPNSIHVRDKNNMNRLPIHTALEKGMEWSIDLVHLITTSREYLKDFDPATKLAPFVLAGMGTSCDLRIIYDLLCRHPEHVQTH